MILSLQNGQDLYCEADFSHHANAIAPGLMDILIVYEHINGANRSIKTLPIALTESQILLEGPPAYDPSSWKAILNIFVRKRTPALVKFWFRKNKEKKFQIVTLDTDQFEIWGFNNQLDFGVF